jgi:hypothetical protein
MDKEGHEVRLISADLKLSTGPNRERCPVLARASDLTAGLQWVRDAYGEGVVGIEIDPMHPDCADAAVVMDGVLAILTIEPVGFNPAA